jgi:hypothetical protein
MHVARSRPRHRAYLACQNAWMFDGGTVIPDALALALRAARRVAVLTGAGCSAESGVPTFRDAQQGLWAQFDPRELATPSAFAESKASGIGTRAPR